MQMGMSWECRTIITKGANQGSAKYADDMLFWCLGRMKPGIVKNVRKEVAELKKNMAAWDIHINEEKTNLLVISADNKEDRKIGRELKKGGIKLGRRKVIKGKKSIKYLGITVNEELEPGDAIHHAVKKGFTVYGKMKWILTKKATSVKVKKMIYNQLIKPTLAYGMSIWPIITEKAFDKMAKCERKILRAITDRYRREDGRSYPNRTLYKESGIKKTIIECLNKAKEKYEGRKECHRSEWYRTRMTELEETRVREVMRIEEYRETVRQWKLAK